LVGFWFALGLIQRHTRAWWVNLPVGRHFVRRPLLKKINNPFFPEITLIYLNLVKFTLIPPKFSLTAAAGLWAIRTEHAKA
jgi:hypothetical protein